MALAVVQTQTKNGASGALQLTGLTTTAGHLFLVASSSGATTTAVTDSASNTWAQLVGVATNEPTYIWATNNDSPKAITSVTVTTGTGFGAVFVFYEIAGANNAVPLDTSNNSSAASGTAATSNASGSPRGDVLAIGAAGWVNSFSSAADTGPTFTTAAGTNTFVVDTEGTTFYKISSSYLVTTAAKAQTFSTTTSGSSAWGAVVALIKPVALALNNYASPHVGDGLSTGEKIR